MSETADKKAARKAKKASRGEKDEKIFKRPELAGAVADKTGLPRTKASAAVEAVFDILSEKLKEGQEVKVKLLGFDDRGKVRLSMKQVDQTTGEDLTKKQGASAEAPQS